MSQEQYPERSVSWLSRREEDKEILLVLAEKYQNVAENYQQLFEAGDGTAAQYKPTYDAAHTALSSAIHTTLGNQFESEALLRVFNKEMFTYFKKPL